MTNAATARRPPDDAPTDPMLLVRSRADALYRAAVECCHQHDRSARLSSSPDDAVLENRHVDAMCRMCDGSLTAMADQYTEAAASLHPAQDETWWHKANALWHASREYARRHAGCDEMLRTLSSRHDADQLASMQLEYELEASALLALRHASEAYRRTRGELA